MVLLASSAPLVVHIHAGHSAHSKDSKGHSHTNSHSVAGLAPLEAVLCGLVRVGDGAIAEAIGRQDSGLVSVYSG